MGLFSRIFGYIWDFFAGAAVNVLDAGLQSDPSALIGVLAGITIWLGCACWASSIAEARLHSPKLHFFAGLFVPVIYPIILLFAMDVKYGEGARKKAEEEAAAQAQAEEAFEEEEDFEEEQEYDQAYFKEIARDDEGNFVGPWRITFGENEIVAQRIVEPLPHVVVIETVPTGPKGKPQRLRIPYGEIESCVRA